MKLTPMWSEPHRIWEKLLNSYKLETLEGQPLEGKYHARRLQEFIPREGTELAAQQKERTTKETEEDLDSGITEMIDEERGDEPIALMNSNRRKPSNQIRRSPAAGRRGRLQNGGGWMEQWDQD